MALSTNAPTAANLAAMIPEVWSPIVNTANFPEAVLTNFCLDLSPFVVAGGDVVHVPDLYTNVLTSSTQSTEGTEITPVVAALVDDSITVTTHEYVAVLIGDNTMSQLASIYNLNEEYAREAQGVLMNVIEAALAAEWSSLTTSVGDTSNALSDADIRVAISTLESANFRQKDMALFVHPEVYWTQILGISQYYTFDTSRFDAVMSGVLGGRTPSDGQRHTFKGQLYDIPVFTTTNIVNALQTYRNLLLTPKAFAWAIRPFGGSLNSDFGTSPLRFRVQSQYVLDFLATLTVVDFSYGVGTLRADGGIVLNSSNAFITS